MDFNLSEEQQMLQDSARRMLEKHCHFEARRPIIEHGSFSAAHWRTFAELGWLGLSIPEEYGGLGGDPASMAVLMEEFGRVLLVEPVWAISVLAAQTLVAAGDEAKAQAILPLLVAGDARPVLAHGEEDAGGVIEHVTTSAERNASGGWTLSGSKTLVVGGNIADLLIVSARTAGHCRDREGISLFLVKPDTPGLTRHDVRLIDNRWAAHLQLDAVQVSEQDLLGTLHQGYTALQSAHAHGLVALCAEAIGVMEQALWITRDYLKVRKQFGAPLSSFQALQHRMSEMLAELELSRAMVFRALSHFDAAQPARQLALSSTKAHIGQSGKFVCGQAIQLHGGIGVTEEYVIGHHFKRMTLIEQAMGNSHFHLQRLAEHECEVPGAPVALDQPVPASIEVPVPAELVHN
ncbi:acyl-CoA dehydrogenase [Pseudomonas baltica]|uniref:acyl-CoA dehydrogenase family protein n=1 Tax=Pseudomonas baltica TaxID=2762576 RepID=UPI00289B616C|nr:acyl-CoA dehydrogenase [Pseudomonas baltica]